MSLEAALVCAEAGVPVGFLSLTLACASAPATMAGNLVVNMAAVLAGIVLLQLAHPGAPVFLAGAPSVMDLKTGGYTGGSPEDYVLAAAATQLAHHFGFAMNMGTMASGAKEPGWQAAVDDALSTLASVSAGAEMMSGCGLLDGSKTLSYAHLLMEAEVYGIVGKTAGGIEVSDETLALDVIRKVGPNGTYLAEKHTRAHMGEIWRPGVWDRTPYDAWLAAGKKGALENAEERAREILASHVPEPLPQDVRDELRLLVVAADAELAGRRDVTRAMQPATRRGRTARTASEHAGGRRHGGGDLPEAPDPERSTRGVHRGASVRDGAGLGSGARQ